MRKKNLFLICLSLVLFIAGTINNSQAQNNAQQNKISGKVIDSVSKEPIQFAMVMLLNPVDSVIKTGLSTNEKGEFILEGAEGKFLLKVRMMGYKESIMPVIPNNNNTFALGEISLSPTVKELNTVTILAKRPIIVSVSGGYRVEIEKNPIVDKNQNALGVLRVVPGVIVRGSQVEVVGKNGLLIQVNGLDKKLDASQVENFLSTISGDNIKQIEVIRNPSSAFNSSVGSVINIITKNSLKEGYFGTLRASVSNSSKYGGSLDFSIVKKKWNFSLSLGERYTKSFNSADNTISYVKNPTTSDVYHETIDNPNIINSIPSGKAEFSYQVNENHIVGGSINFWGDYATSNHFNKVTSNALVPIIPDLTLTQNRRENFLKGSIDVYSKYKFKNKSQLILQFNSAFNDIDNSFENNQTTMVNHLSEIYNNEQNYLSFERAQTFKITYKSNISQLIGCETGAEYNYSTLNDHFNDKPLPPSDQLNPEITNLFRYNENIAAAFVNFNINIKKWNYSFGVRDEYMFYNMLSRELNKNDFKKNGNDNSIYPFISINYNINEKQMLTLGFKQNNERPMFKSYNPFMYLYTPTMYVKGNPDIKPSKTSGVDLTYVFQPSQAQMYMLTGGISYSENLINPEMEVDPVSKRLIFSQQNLGDLQKIYFYLSAQNTISSWFSLQTSISVSEDRYLRMKDSLRGLSTNIPSLVLGLEGSIVLPYKLNFHFVYNFISSGITAQGKTLSSNYVNLSFDRSFFKDKIGTSLTIINPFHRMKSVQEFNTSQANYINKFISEAAVFKLGVNYKFGKAKRSTIQKQSAITNMRM